MEWIFSCHDSYSYYHFSFYKLNKVYFLGGGDPRKEAGVAAGLGGRLPKKEAGVAPRLVSASGIRLEAEGWVLHK